MSTPAFSNTDGTDFPQSALGWPHANPGVGHPNPDNVFPVADRTDRPDTVRGWTVQTAFSGTEGGSNQNTVGVQGV